jgi:hypothetical protein
LKYIDPVNSFLRQDMMEKSNMMNTQEDIKKIFQNEVR